MMRFYGTVIAILPEGVLPGGLRPRRAGPVNVIVAVPGVVPAVTVTVAFPAASVVTLVAERLTMPEALFVTLRACPATGLPPPSVTVTV